MVVCLKPNLWTGMEAYSQAQVTVCLELPLIHSTTELKFLRISLEYVMLLLWMPGTPPFFRLKIEDYLELPAILQRCVSRRNSYCHLPSFSLLKVSVNVPCGHGMFLWSHF